MTMNKNDDLDSTKSEKNQDFLQHLFYLYKNLFIGIILLLLAVYLIQNLLFLDLSQEIQGFLVVIIGLLIIVALDFFKKDKNTNSDIKHQNHDDK